ncbi:MAG: fibronectin type III domain-containing protein [Bryobacteraceae bacterium]
MATLLLASACASQAVEVFKEDFEFRSDYGYVRPGPAALYPEGKYTVDKNPNNSHNLFTSFGDHGTGFGNMLIVNGVANSVVWQRKVSGFNPGQQYVIRLYAASVYPDNPASLQFTVNNTAVGSALSLLPATGAWRLLTVTVPAATSVQTIKVIDTNGSAGGNDFAIDDFEVVEVSTQRSLLREDFEAVTQYRYVPPAPSALYDEGTATVDNNPSYDHPYFAYFADHTGNNGNMLIVNGVPGLAVYTLTTPQFQAGSTYRVSFYARATYPYNPAQLAVRVDGVLSGSLVLPPDGASGAWVQIVAFFLATRQQHLIEIVDLVSGAGGNDFALDDIQITTGPSSDTTPPQITDLGAVAQSSTTAVVTWNTIEYSTTSVDYGVGSACTGLGPYVNATFVVGQHQALIGNLTASTSYCVKVTSTDQAGNQAFQTTTFQTPPPLAAGCVVDVAVIKRTRRVNGNRLVGTVIAFAKSGAWQNWGASVSGELWYRDSAGNTQRLANGSAPFRFLQPIVTGPGPTGDPESPSYEPDPNNPSWSSGPIDLEPRGNGQYWVRGTGTFTSVACLSSPPPIGPLDGPLRDIRRPSAPKVMPDYPDQMHFLGPGRLSSGQYRASTRLVSGNSNYEEYNTFTNRVWRVEESPGTGYVQTPLNCDATYCREVPLRALKASDACRQKTVKIYNDYDGFRSDPLELWINRPYQTGPTSTAPPEEDQGGYKTRVTFEVQDACGDAMSDYGINEQFSNAATQPGVNWPPLEESGDQITGTTVTDFIGAIPGPHCGADAATVCAPAPEYRDIPIGTDWIQRADQTWRVGSSIPGQGITIRWNLFFKYIDHGAHGDGTAGSIVTPFPPQ